MSVISEYFHIFDPLPITKLICAKNEVKYAKVYLTGSQNDGKARYKRAKQLIEPGFSFCCVNGTLGSYYDGLRFIILTV